MAWGIDKGRQRAGNKLLTWADGHGYIVGGIRQVDRVDACFVANALDSRISGDRESLDLLAASSFDRLNATAARVRALAADWPPAIIAAHELEAIAELGGAALDQPRAVANLIIFVDKLRAIISPAAPLPRNRHERRALASVAH